MKHTITVLLIPVLCLLLASCAAKTPGDLLSLPERLLPTQTEPETQTQQELLPMPDEETVRNAFEKALEVYGWFDLCSLESDSSDTVEYGGQTYYRVISDAVPSYEELRMLVFNLFDTKTGEELLREDSETPPYIDAGGALYCLDFARGVDMSRGDYTLSVEEQNSSVILCRVEVETLEYGGGEEYRRVTGIKEFLYRYERVGLRWVFTDFSLFY